MTIATVLYSLVFASLVGAAAAALDALFRLGKRPARGIWAAALCITVIGTAVAPLRVSVRPLPPAPLTDAMTTTFVPAAPSLAERIAQPFATVRRFAADVADRALARIPATRASRIERWLAAAWLAASVLMFALLAAVHTHFSRRRRTWPRATVDGTDVRLAPRTGPAVMGLVTPEIVVPAWLVSRAAGERQLVLDHEREHLRARDPLLLAGAYAAAALVPWHPAAWWMLARLRLAVELDCDARVLRRGVAPRSYGALLIDLATRHPASAAGIPALGLTQTNLERRLIAMTTHRKSSTYVRRAALGATALIAFAIACDAPVPTSAKATPAKAALAAPTSDFANVASPGDSVTFRIDGFVVNGAQAESLQVHDSLKAFMIRSFTKAGSPKHVDLIMSSRSYSALMAETHMGSQPKHPAAAFNVVDDKVQVAGAMATSAKTPFKGLIMIDGAPATGAALKQLPPQRIQSVDILKGAAAASKYSDPRAANGVISVTTKHP
jgi:beta-lactamase regulating signal transducer with metallopeptidase domain